ncbi:EfeM/EfeO family lipoprotein [Arthrobacter sp. zg-Y859]|uniref:EfeM/EfeO family lipoprotein n=1 Tax=Arthrobacter jinronghuae TaxID=2964609 RepID=A0ABT1NUZ7_9MICC|nr:iron uptake system protein EfeO [Arthrobacter jinronghuae]MCQ1951559.1 EfeM/EfeO family lipoprotein [Arthrobacter jinronghuae]UWX79634.1 EfeM/EfeO family lipoprotein [Arthrobacter jinronghuae]
MKKHLSLAPAALLAVTAMTLSGCTDNSAGTSGAISVTSTADACTVSTESTPGGTIRFDVTNDGSEVTEFYLLAEDGLRIVGEVENIGPGLTRDLVLVAPEGNYYTACKPGMVGDGIRSEFTVTAAPAGQEVSADRAALQDTAVNLYAAYVKDQAAQLVEGTGEFAAAFAAGDEDTARTLYPQVRMHWERIEPVAESFGDLDPILDAREADLEEGDEFTGWHRAEKDLWAPVDYKKMTAEERTYIADKMVADTNELYSRTQELTYTADKLANGAKELLDEVATGKVTGEEEFFSHTDLWDFQANVDGARIAYEDLKPLLAENDSELDAALEENFSALQALLDQYRVGEGFKLYTELTDEQVQELSAAVDSLSEPLSKLTAAVVK